MRCRCRQDDAEGDVGDFGCVVHVVEAKLGEMKTTRQASFDTKDFMEPVLGAPSPLGQLLPVTITAGRSIACRETPL